MMKMIFSYNGERFVLCTAEPIAYLSLVLNIILLNDTNIQH